MPNGSRDHPSIATPVLVTKLYIPCPGPRSSPAPPESAADRGARVKGHLDGRRAAWFDGLSVTHESDRTVVLYGPVRYGPVVDRAALHSLLKNEHDLGMPLVSVKQLDPARQTL
jgi:hypothetical protein